MICLFCDRKSNIPIVSKPKTETLEQIIKVAVIREKNKNYDKYKKCTELSGVTASDLKSCSYHRSCHREFTRISTDGNENSPNVDQLTVEDFTAQYIERYVLSNKVNTTDIKAITSEYLKLAVSTTEPNENTTRKRIKSYILSRDDILILRPPENNKSEVVVSTINVEKLFFKYNNEENMNVKESSKLYQAIQIIRDKILAEPFWTFEGSFKDFKADDELLELIKVLIGGRNPHPTKTDFISKYALLLLQVIEQVVITNRQAKHSSSVVRRTRERPLNVGLALSTHIHFRSKKLVNDLKELAFGITYRKLVQVKNDLARSLKKIEDETGGFVAPQWLRPNEFMSFAIDNIDFCEATWSGKNSLHGTGLCVFQKKRNDLIKDESIHFTRSNEKTYTNQLACQLLKCWDPQPKPNIYPIDINSFKAKNHSEKVTHTRLWMTSFLDTGTEQSPKVLTWSGFNSKCAKEFKPINNIGFIAPLLRTPPTEYDTLLTDIMRAHRINVHYNGVDAVTVIALDMQLFDMAMKLWATSEDIRKKFVFIAGPLHTVFWALQNLGTYIKGSGIEQTWIESGMYSSKTVEKILSGKQMKRSLEAHMTTILALCNIYLNKEIDHLANKDDVRKFIDKIKENANKKSDKDFQKATDVSMTQFLKLDLTKLFDISDSDGDMKKFIFNYIKQFETILLYIKSTREADIELQLSSLVHVTMYFFAHNNLMYARLLSLQLHLFQKLRDDVHVLWLEFKKGNFVVTKNQVKFTSIGLDHGMEQQIKTLKIAGGVKGITQNETSLERYFLIAPALNSIVNEFNQLFIDGKESELIHHELIGSKSSRMLKNVMKMTNILKETGLGAESSDTPLHNIFTKEIIPQNISRDIINRDTLGQKIFSDFVTERLVEGLKSV